MFSFPFNVPVRDLALNVFVPPFQLSGPLQISVSWLEPNFALKDSTVMSEVEWISMLPKDNSTCVGVGVYVLILNDFFPVPDNSVVVSLLYGNPVMCRTMVWVPVYLLPSKSL